MIFKHNNNNTIVAVAVPVYPLHAGASLTLSHSLSLTHSFSCTYNIDTALLCSVAIRALSAKTGAL